MKGSNKMNAQELQDKITEIDIQINNNHCMTSIIRAAWRQSAYTPMRGEYAQDLRQLDEELQGLLQEVWQLEQELDEIRRTPLYYVPKPYERHPHVRELVWLPSRYLKDTWNWTFIGDLR